jgi:hypothetical protein
VIILLPSPLQHLISLSPPLLPLLSLSPSHSLVSVKNCITMEKQEDRGFRDGRFHLLAYSQVSFLLTSHDIFSVLTLTPLITLSLRSRHAQPGNSLLSYNTSPWFFFLSYNFQARHDTGPHHETRRGYSRVYTRGSCLVSIASLISWGRVRAGYSFL